MAPIFRWELIFSMQWLSEPISNYNCLNSFFFLIHQYFIFILHFFLFSFCYSYLFCVAAQEPESQKSGHFLSTLIETYATHWRDRLHNWELDTGLVITVVCKQLQSYLTKFSIFKLKPRQTFFWTIRVVNFDCLSN